MVDAGDIDCNPFDITTALAVIEAGILKLASGDKPVTLHAREFHTTSFTEIIERISHSFGDVPLYISIDIDVLNPAHTRGAGTPHAAGLTSHELLELLRGLKCKNLVGADVVEVAPAYDHASITAVAAAHCAYDLVSLMSYDLAWNDN